MVNYAIFHNFVYEAYFDITLKQVRLYVHLPLDRLHPGMYMVIYYGERDYAGLLTVFTEK